MGFEDKVKQSINQRIRQKLVEDGDSHGSIVNTIHAAVQAYIWITGKEPTMLSMGWNQQEELRRELDSNHLVMMPFQGHTGAIAGVAVTFVKDENLMEMV